MLKIESVTNIEIRKIPHKYEKIENLPYAAILKLGITLTLLISPIFFSTFVGKVEI